jgi:uncharacterized protein
MKPILINNLDFAIKNQEVSGEIALKNLSRLTETISKTSNYVTNIRYKLVGSTKKMQLPSLRLELEAVLPVLCQRCLEEMPIGLSLKFDYVIAEAVPPEFDENDEIDWLEPSQYMNLNELIEDELLIAMPIAPVHEASCTKTSMQSGEKPNPFAALKGHFK